MRLPVLKRARYLWEGEGEGYLLSRDRYAHGAPCDLSLSHYCVPAVDSFALSRARPQPLPRGENRPAVETVENTGCEHGRARKWPESLKILPPPCPLPPNSQFTIRNSRSGARVPAERPPSPLPPLPSAFVTSASMGRTSREPAIE